MLGLVLARQLMLQELSVPLLTWFAPVLVACILVWLIIMLALPPRFALVLAGLPLFFCIGLLHGWQALQPPSDASRLARLLEERSRVTVYGRVLNMVESDGLVSRCTLEVYGLLRHGRDEQTGIFQPASGKVALQARGVLSEKLTPGHMIMALGWAERPKQRQNLSRDAALRYAAKGIDAILWLQSADAVLLLAEAKSSPWMRLRFAPEHLRHHTAHFLQNHFRPEIAGIYQALLIGSYQGVPPELLEQFKASGVMHILAISGLHLSLVGGMCAALFYWLLRRSTRVMLYCHTPALALLLTAPILLLYACLAGLNIPVLRALVSALLVLCAVVLRRRRMQFHLVASAALLVLALHPLSLFTASFQLSFSAVAAIILILPRLPWFNQKAEKSRSSRIRAALLSMLWVSVAATIGTLPIMLYHFNRMSLIGPVMSILIEPLLCLWSLPLGLIALVLLPIVPQAALFVLQMGSYGIEATLALLKVAVQLPFASLWTITPHFTEIVVFFLAALLLLQNWPRRNYWRIAGALLACALILFFTSSLWWRSNNSVLRVSFIDVGQGASTLIELPNGKRMLIDCGGYHQNGFDVGSRIVAPFLWQQRVWRLDTVLVTHADADHYSGVPFLLQRFKPKVLYTNVDSGADAAYLQMLSLARQQGLQVQPIAGRVEIMRESGLVLEGLGVTTEEQSANLSENDRSLVVRLEYGQRAFLFPGDSAFSREALLVQAAQNGQAELRADVLMAGHHGSINSTGAAFLDAVAPSVIVISAGVSRWGTHPALEHLHNWQQRSLALFATARHGTIVADTDGRYLCLKASNHAKELCLD